MIKEPTHIEGNVLDQVHVKDTQQLNKYLTEVHSKYYTDHKALAVIVMKS